MRVVDSSGWLEYLAEGPSADDFVSALDDPEQLIVPTISLYEVYKRVLQQRGEGTALQAVSVMIQAQVVDLDMDLALDAARLSLELKMPMADSIILATARAYEATLWTQDAHFRDVADVRYIAAK